MVAWQVIGQPFQRLEVSGEGHEASTAHLFQGNHAYAKDMDLHQQRNIPIQRCQDVAYQRDLNVPHDICH